MVSVKSTIAEEHGSKIQYLDKSKIDFEQTTCAYFTFINENGKPEKNACRTRKHASSVYKTDLFIVQNVDH